MTLYIICVRLYYFRNNLASLKLLPNVLAPQNMSETQTYLVSPTCEHNEVLYDSSKSTDGRIMDILLQYTL